MKGKKKSKGEGRKPASEVRGKPKANKTARSSRIDKLKVLAGAGAMGAASEVGRRIGGDAYEHFKIIAHTHGPMVAQVISDGVHQVLRNPVMTLEEYERYMKQKQRRSAKSKTSRKK